VVAFHPSFHPYQQGIEECGPLLLSDPLKFRWAEVWVGRFSEGSRRRARGVGARAHTHLERHLSLVRPLGFGVPESVRQEAEIGMGVRPLTPWLLFLANSSCHTALLFLGNTFTERDSAPVLYSAVLFLSKPAQLTPSQPTSHICSNLIL
jgi:hypothetical protein